MKKNKVYHIGFAIPMLIIFGVFFLIPTALSLYFSMTIWNFDSAKFCGLRNYISFFSTNSLVIALKNSFVYVFLVTIGVTVIGFFLAVFLTSKIKTKNLIRSIVFFPNLVSALAVGITFSTLMHTSKGLFNRVIESLGGTRIDFLGDPDVAIFSVIGVIIWKALSITVVILIAGITSIDSDYYEAAAIDGASGWDRLFRITLPLCRSSINTVIILTVIGNFRGFDVMWAMTGGGSRICHR